MAASASVENGTTEAHSTKFLAENAKAVTRPSEPTLSPNDNITVPPSPNHEEHQYLNLIRHILSEGEHRPDRTGTGTLSIFSPPQLRFSLSKANPTSPPSIPIRIPVLPVLTTKRVFLRAVTTELLWFISGATSSTALTKSGIHIWDGNGSRAYLDKLGFPHREEGDLGPVYGFQWRHFGAEYSDCHADYSGQGVDQLQEIVRKLRDDPYDRRIILSAWNVADLKNMALPPCHIFAQFYVSFPDARRGEAAAAAVVTSSSSPQTQSSNGTHYSQEEEKTANAEAKPKSKGHLSCTLYQRSADVGLGLPFNIASYALLTHILAHACDLVPGTLTHTIGDAHIYLDHVEALKEQLGREPRQFPELEIKRGDRGSGVVDGWTVEELEIKGYKPHGKIGLKMSV